MSRKLPRVLLVGPEPFNYSRGFGITMSNLFSYWPNSDLATIYTNDMLPDYDYCQKQFHLSLKRSEVLSICRSLADRFGRAKGEKSRQKAEAASGNESLRPVTAGCKTRSILRPHNGLGLYHFHRYELTDTLRSNVMDFDPEILYCAPTSLKALVFMYALHKTLSIPLVVHVMDDWIFSGRNATGLAERFWASQTNIKLIRLLSDATLRFGASEELSAVYAKRYGMHFSTFQNCPEADVWVRNGKKSYLPSNPFKFVFTGALYSSCNRSSILEFSKAIDYLNTNKLAECSLEIHTNAADIEDFAQELNRCTGCTVTKVDSDQTAIARLYGSADALFLPFDFSESAIVASRYSMPAKLPAYMFSGTPIFAYGPYLTTSVKYLADSHSACAVTEKVDVSELAEKVREFVSDTPGRITISANARKASDELRADIVRPKFAEKLAGISREQ